VTTVVVVIAVIVILLAGTLLPLLGRARRKRLSSNDEAIAARAAYNKLGFHVEDLPATDDAGAADLLAQARERWNTTGAMLARARSEKDFTLAQQTAEQGLALVKDAYAKMGKTF
jgi:type II secretory pathway pseudopilin PulG